MEDLILEAPNPAADRSALNALRDPANPATLRFAKRLHTEPDWRRLPLGKLLPGLAIVNSASFGRRLSIGALTALTRAEIRSWAALAEMTPATIYDLSGIGVERLEEILLDAAGEWASAYLRSVEGSNGDAQTGRALDIAEPEGTHSLGEASEEKLLRRSKHEQLEELISRTPDPAADQRLLMALRDPEGPDTRWLARRFQTDSDLQRLSLRELLPGVGVVESPKFSIRLSVRAANCIERADAGTLRELAGMTPAAMLALPGVGVNVAEEVLAVVVAEWASAYLHQVGSSGAEPDSVDETSSVDSDTERLSAALATICAWAAQARRAKGAVEAIRAAAEEKERLPAKVDRALRELSRFGAAPSGHAGALADAFARIEQTSGFDIFRRRQLDAGSRPTLAELAGELGISPDRVWQYESMVQAMLSKNMRDSAWPISKVVDELRNRLGSVARPAELLEVLAAVDPGGEALSEDMPHRVELLLWLADYRRSEQWVLDPDIEILTKAAFNAQTDSGSVDLDVVERQLARLGVREGLRLPWIMSQPSFQIINRKLARVGEK